MSAPTTPLYNWWRNLNVGEKVQKGDQVRFIGQTDWMDASEKAVDEFNPLHALYFEVRRPQEVKQ